MGKGGGIALKSISLFIRAIQFGCAAVILGIFSYFLASLTDHHLHIPTYEKAVEGISGAAVIYSLLALVLVCCLGGVIFFSFIGTVLDLAFCGAFIYLAYATRHGASSCKGTNVQTPLGTGNTDTNDRVSDGNGGVIGAIKVKTACRLNTAAFAVAVIGAVFFFLSIFLNLALARHHKKEKAFGPGPNNGYTAGSPKRKFWQRKPKTTGAYAEKNPDALPTHATPADARQSYATESTAVGTQGEPTYMKYGPTTGGVGPAHGNTPQTGTYQDGYQTTTTTHVPHQQQGYAQNTNGTF